LRAYLICANQRSGSNLLCRALSDTGVAGHPTEYFLCGPPDAFAPGWKFWEEGPLAQEHGISDRRRYLDLVRRLGSTPNGVFGAKLMANNLIWVEAKLRELEEFQTLSRAAMFHELFPDLRVIHLIRRDLVRQAVSWARAALDGVWVVSDSEPARPTGEPLYDFSFISNLEGLLRQGEEDWRALYLELGAVPHEVVYEDLVDTDHYEASVQGVLRHLDLDDTVPIRPPRTHRQADVINGEWVERYRQDRASQPATPDATAP
jgi:LPS sulfotransferase NodH